MKKADWIVTFLALAAIAILIWLTTSIAANAEPEYVEPALMRVTCYTWTGNKTATGIYPYQGIVAGRPEWSGHCAILYDKDMQYIGVFEFRDTGGARSLQNGTSIDVYRDSLAECQEWIATYGDYLYVQVIPCEG